MNNPYPEFNISAWDKTSIAPRAKPVTPLIASWKAELEQLTEDLEYCDGRAYEAREEGREEVKTCC